MAHVTFIHGIANKPQAQDLLLIWRRALTEVYPSLDLAAAGVSSSLVYWADLLYEAPDPNLAAHEGVLENTVQSVDASGDAPLPVPQSEAEARFLQAMRKRLTTLSDASIDAAAANPGLVVGGSGALERVPLPWFLKKPLMSALLRDVHHYLFDKLYAPPGRTPVRIQQTIRQRFTEALGASGIRGPHIIVSHSMGTVIAYDCLLRVPDCPVVDGLITLGSPLGLDEIQDQLQPGWSREDGFPARRLRGAWHNLFDPLDPVCGFDARLANDFHQAGQSRVIDTEVTNPGLWRHSATKYLRQPAFIEALRGLLEL